MTILRMKEEGLRPSTGDLNLKECKDAIDIHIKNSYIRDEPFNAIVLAEALAHLSRTIKDRAMEHLPIRFGEDSTVEYNGTKFTLRRIPQYEYPDDPRLVKMQELVEQLETKHKEEVKSYKDSIKTIKEQLVQSREAKIKDTKHSLVIK